MGPGISPQESGKAKHNGWFKSKQHLKQQSTWMESDGDLGEIQPRGSGEVQGESREVEGKSGYVEDGGNHPTVSVYRLSYQGEFPTNVPCYIYSVSSHPTFCFVC